MRPYLDHRPIIEHKFSPPGAAEDGGDLLQFLFGKSVSLDLLVEIRRTGSKLSSQFCLTDPSIR